MIPIDIEVFLIGFDGNGGYAHKQDAGQLLSLLNSAASHVCPHSLETRGEIGVCFQLNFQVLGGDELGQEAEDLLRGIEAHLKANVRDVTHMQPWTARINPAMENGTLEYIVDAAGLEPLFDRFLAYATGEEPGAASEHKGHEWHEHNAIFVINPSKVRINPRGTPDDQNHKVPDFFFEWHSHTYDPAQLDKEEAGLVYRYSYNGAGEAATWLSSRNYAVVDVAAGPTSYGPMASEQGAVAPGSLPSLRDVYRAIFADLKDVGPGLTAQEHAQVVGQHAQKALFEGGLAALLASASRGLFAPDMASEHIEYARNILVPVVLLTDYEPTDDDYEKHMQQEDFMHVNLTHVEQAVARLIDQQQEAVVVSAHHPLSRHKGVAAALWKARKQKAEQALETKVGEASRVGFHTVSHTSVDPEALMEELALAADVLTHGLTGAAHTMDKADAHPLEQLRHEGTRVVPVFVISLMKAPDDIMFSNREMVAASHDAVLVLQLRSSAQWGGVKDDYFTGHVANGKRVMADARDVTRHVVAGLAQSLAGVLPPYARPRPPGHAGGALVHDWRWAAGATPFGPYSNFSGVSGLMQGAARRNLLLSHVSAALRASQEKLDEVDDFVEAHFQGPWDAAGMGATGAEGRKHFLDTVADTRHGFKTAITADKVAVLEGSMGALTTELEGLAFDLFSHDFEGADRIVRETLLPAAANLVSGLDATLDDAREIMACCAAVHVSRAARAVQLVVACAAGFVAMLFVAVVFERVVLRRRRLTNALQLPTYGMSQYSRPTSRQHSWQL